PYYRADAAGQCPLCGRGLCGPFETRPENYCVHLMKAANHKRPCQIRRTEPSTSQGASWFWAEPNLYFMLKCIRYLAEALPGDGSRTKSFHLTQTRLVNISVRSQCF